jgi:hypothetical protein
VLTTSTGFRNPADKMCASCNVWERSDSKGGNQYVTVCYDFLHSILHIFQYFGYRLLVSRCLHQFCTEKTFPFMIFSIFSTTKPLVSTSFVAHDDTFPLFSPVFPPGKSLFLTIFESIL